MTTTEERIEEEQKRLNVEAASQGLDLSGTHRVWRLGNAVTQNTLLQHTPHRSFLETLLREQGDALRWAARRAAGRNTNFSPSWLLDLRPDDSHLADGILMRPGDLPASVLDRIVDMPELAPGLSGKKNLSLEASRKMLTKLAYVPVARPVGLLLSLAEQSPYLEILVELSEQRGYLIAPHILQNEILKDRRVLHQLLMMQPAMLDGMPVEKKAEVQQWLWKNVPAYAGMPVEWAYKLLNGSTATTRGTDT